jgi:hypothetical protein
MKIMEQELLKYTEWLSISTHIADPKGLVKMYLKAQSKAENLPISDVTQWVAVDEKLPEDSEWILLANVDDQWVDRGEMTVTGKWYNGECEIYPTHWAKLPEPPCG